MSNSRIWFNLRFHTSNYYKERCFGMIHWNRSFYPWYHPGLHIPAFNFLLVIQVKVCKRFLLFNPFKSELLFPSPSYGIHLCSGPSVSATPSIKLHRPQMLASVFTFLFLPHLLSDLSLLKLTKTTETT
jgi:hypothetical protein